MNSVRDDFLDDGVDEQVMLEIKQLWEQKVAATHATDHTDGMGLSSSSSSQQSLQQTAHQQVASGIAGQCEYTYSCIKLINY